MLTDEVIDENSYIHISIPEKEEFKLCGAIV